MIQIIKNVISFFLAPTLNCALGVVAQIVTANGLNKNYLFWLHIAASVVAGRMIRTLTYSFTYIDYLLYFVEYRVVEVVTR